MPTHELTNDLIALAQKYGAQDVVRTANKLLTPANQEHLTIIPDDALHSIPTHLISGESFVVSRKNLNAETDQTLTNELIDRLMPLEHKLRSREWRRVSLILTGHCLLSVAIKMLVYRITHIETEDIAYFSGLGYRKVSINYRDLVSSRSKNRDTA